MKHFVLVAVSVMALGVAGCKKEQAPASQATEASVAPAEGPVAATTSPAQDFANAAAASDAFEIETSKLAASKAQSAKVKSFAQSMTKAHTDSTAKLKAAAAAAAPAITPNPALSASQQQALSALNSKSGAEFDAAYAKAQADAHQVTLDTLKAYAAAGEVASLKAFATELVPVVTAHLNMAKALK